MRVVVITIGLLSLCLSSFTQDEFPDPNRRQPYIQMLYHNGIFWSRTEYLQEQFDAGYWGLEARLGFQTTGRKIWQQYNRYPKIGFGLYYADLVMNRQDTMVGNPFAFYGFYNTPIATVGRFAFSTDLSVGLSYTPIVHDPVTNPYNDVVASHLNLFFGFKLNMDVSLTNRLDMNLGYGLTHHSNGRIHMPQKGVNTWGLSLGMRYMLVEPVERIYTEPPEYTPKGEVQFMAAVGTVEEKPLNQTNPNRYFNTSVTVDYAYKFNPRMAITLGLDWFYDGSTALAIGSVPPENVTNYEKMYLGTHLGYQQTIDRITLMFNLGTYFVQHTQDRGFWFARGGGRLRLTDRMYVHVAIKTKNGVRSDWIEWGVAYHLKVN